MEFSFEPICRTKRHDKYILTFLTDWRFTWQNEYERRSLSKAFDKVWYDI